jgi:N utilization substance protein B
MVALQGLYELDIQRSPADADMGAVLAPWLAEADLQGEPADYARQLLSGAWAHHERYDQMIAGASDHWDVARMAVVDRNILRLGLYELIERPDVPARVVIDEAIELGRTFGSAETPPFINGVLDAIWKRDPACQAARAAREALAHPTAAVRNESNHGTL